MKTRKDKQEAGTTVSLHEKIEEEHLYDGRLLTEKEVKKIKKSFEKIALQEAQSDASNKTVSNHSGRIIKFFRKKEKHKIKNINVIEFISAQNEKSYWAVYLGKKHGKHLGMGGFGKVKLMQNIETGQWSAVKILQCEKSELNKKLKEIETEKRNLHLLSRTPGGFFDQKSRKYYLGVDLAFGKNIKNRFIEQGSILFNAPVSEDGILMVINQKTGEPEAAPLEKKTTYINILEDGRYQIFYFDKKNHLFEKIIVNDLHENKKFISALKKIGLSLMPTNEFEIEQTENLNVYHEIHDILNIPENCLLPIRLDSLLDVGLAMINAVKEVHDAGLIHRDIKPEQFIYNEENKKAVLIDLGSGVLDSEKNTHYGDGVTRLYLPVDFIKHVSIDSAFLLKERIKKDWISQSSSSSDEKFEKYYEKCTSPTKFFEKKYGVSLLDGSISNDFRSQIIKEKSAFMDSKEYKDFVENKKKYTQSIARELSTFVFTIQSDINALGISIGQLFGVAEKMRTRDHFGLENPPYINPLDSDKAGCIYRIMSFEQAKDNNLYNVPDSLLKELVSFLGRMTDEEPSHRPDLHVAKAFFRDFQMRLQEYFKLQRKSKSTDSIKTSKLSLLSHSNRAVSAPVSCDTDNDSPSFGLYRKPVKKSAQQSSVSATSVSQATSISSSTSSTSVVSDAANLSQDASAQTPSLTSSASDGEQEKLKPRS